MTIVLASVALMATYTRVALIGIVLGALFNMKRRSKALLYRRRVHVVDVRTHRR